MGDRVEMMTAERSTPSVFFMRFMRLKAQHPNSLICFFEGEDRKYYSIRLDLLAHDHRWDGIDCGGKKNVLDLHKLVRSNRVYADALIAGFVDRDFDNPIDAILSDEIYETPCYSVENLYCTENCLRKILEIEYKLDLNEAKPNLLEDAVSDFRIYRDDFHEVIRRFNVWIFAHRRRERAEGRRPLNLKNIQLSQIVKISADGVRAEIDPRNFETLFHDCYKITEDELRDGEKQLGCDRDGFFYRGKYEIEFVRKYLEKLRAECANKESRMYNEKISVKLSLSKGNFISEISQYAETPNRLREFIQKTFGKTQPFEATA